MTDQDLNEIRARCEATEDLIYDVPLNAVPYYTKSALVTVAQTLLAEIERLKADLAAMTKQRDKAVEDIKRLLLQDFEEDKCWACSHPFDCGKERRCEPQWRGLEGTKCTNT